MHVIDNEAKFDNDFGRSIMAGLLGLPAEALKRYVLRLDIVFIISNLFILYLMYKYIYIFIIYL